MLPQQFEVLPGLQIRRPSEELLRSTETTTLDMQEQLTEPNGMNDYVVSDSIS